MHVQDLVAEERQSLERIEGVEHHEAAKIHMILDSGPGHVERSERIVAQQDTQFGIETGAALLIESLEFIEPQAAAGSRTHAEFQNENLRRQLLLLLHVLQ